MKNEKSRRTELSYTVRNYSTVPESFLSSPFSTPSAATTAFAWQVSADAAAVHAIHQTAIAGVPCALVRSDSLAHFEQHTGRDGVTLVCHGGKELVAYGVLGIDSCMADHLAALLKADAARFAILDGAGALPGWRGHGLHQAAIEQRTRHAAALGRTLIGATVSPRNLRAMASMFRSGFTIQGTALMYGGHERLLMARDTLLAPPQAPVEREIGAGDWIGHQDGLAVGLAGVRLRQGPDGRWHVGYGRVI